MSNGALISERLKPFIKGMARMFLMDFHKAQYLDLYFLLFS